MGKYKISLVVPIYGVEKYIRQFAESALGQTYDCIQFVFVNDGTKDRSMDILNEVIDSGFSYRRPDVIIVDKQNEGLPLARKTGLEHAEGEYVLFADSDDWLEKDAVEKIMAAADETNADIIYFDLVKEYGDKVSIKRERDYTADTKGQFIVNIFNYKSQGYTVTKCFRKKLYEDHDIHHPVVGMHEDICLMSQLIFHAESLHHLKEVLYHYRKDNPDSFCAQNRKRRHIASSVNMLDLYSYYREILDESPLKDVAGGILMRAGWHSMIHGHDFFKEHSFLAEDIVKSRLSTGYRLPLVAQLIVKIKALFQKI